MQASAFYAMLFRMKYIHRWGLMRNTRWENLSEHALETAFLAHALVLIRNRRLGGSLPVEAVVLRALYHDTAEILTGDLPTPVKHDNPRLQRSYQEMEAAAAARLLALLPADIREEMAGPISGEGLDEASAAIVKAADKLSALIKCIEEEKAGNREFAQAAAACRAALAAMALPEVEIFLAEFLPAFSLSLDALQP